MISQCTPVSRNEFFRRFVKISYEIVMSVTSIGRQFRIAGTEFVKPRHMVKWEPLASDVASCHLLRVGPIGYVGWRRSSMKTNLNAFKFAKELSGSFFRKVYYLHLNTFGKCFSERHFRKVLRCKAALSNKFTITASFNKHFVSM